ncbi:hypothetical protein SUGI_0582810 [Cryptomeria japonica]|nr:hypothetical protein SUGI_0582810 [Cryptomeria japonica]
MYKLLQFFATCKTHKFYPISLTCKREIRTSNPCKTLQFFHTGIKPVGRGISYIFHALKVQSSDNNCSDENITAPLRFGRAWINTTSAGFLPEGEQDKVNGGEPVVFARHKKARKIKSIWVCENCGEEYGQWWGMCPHCRKADVLRKFNEAQVDGMSYGGGAGSRVAEAKVASYRVVQADKGWLSSASSSSVSDSQPESLSNVNKGLRGKQFRLPLEGNFGMEVARVLGGGLVLGSLVLVGGDPGVGKSTLLLQIGALLAEGCEVYTPAPVLYVSGEESVEQIGSRGARMNIESNQLHLYSSTDIEDILDKVQKLRPRAVIVDSIQTVYLREITGSAGSVSQVKECATALLRFAKSTHIPIFLVGHVTKTGDIAGPRILEHIVDVVLYMEGDGLSSNRLLRAVKNRFGSIDEIGVLEMAKNGLQSVMNPSELYLTEWDTDQHVLAGLAISVIIDGSRPFLIETQALCATGVSLTRRYNGLHENRADMIIAVLIKQVGLKLQNQAVFLNVVGGVRLTEPAGDLAIAAGICSSFLEIAIPTGIAFIGEIGLGGELRSVARMNIRVNELAKLGFKKCIIPKSSAKSITGFEWEEMSIISCSNVKEMIGIVFPQVGSPDFHNPAFEDLEAPDV